MDAKFQYTTARLFARKMMNAEHSDSERAKLMLMAFMHAQSAAVLAEEQGNGKLSARAYALKSSLHHAFDKLFEPAVFGVAIEVFVDWQQRDPFADWPV